MVTEESSACSDGLSSALRASTTSSTSTTPITRETPTRRFRAPHGVADPTRARAALRRPAVPESQGRPARVRPCRPPVRGHRRRRHGARRRRRIDRGSGESRAGPRGQLGKLMRIDPRRPARPGRSSVSDFATPGVSRSTGKRGSLDRRRRRGDLRGARPATGGATRGAGELRLEPLEGRRSTTGGSRCGGQLVQPRSTSTRTAPRPAA